MTDTFTLAYLGKLNKNSSIVTELSVKADDGETKFIGAYR